VQKGLTGFFTEHVRWWVTNDGSGRVTYSMRANGLRSSFTTTFGAGRYDSLAYPNRRQMIGHHMPPSVIGSLVPLGMRFDPERLPTESAALTDALRGDVAKAARLQAHGLYAERSVPEATKELELIANALQDPMDPAALRRAFFTTAAKLPGIGVQRGVIDPLGRRGEAVTASEGVAVESNGHLNRSAHETFAVIFNPTTTHVLAETQYPSDHPAQADGDYTVFTGEVVVGNDAAASVT
jgi:hypothetical protein